MELVVGLGVVAGLAIVAAALLTSPGIGAPWHAPVETVAGLSAAEVRARLGRPDAVSRYASGDLPSSVKSAFRDLVGVDEVRRIRELRWYRRPGVTVWMYEEANGSWVALKGAVGR